MVIGHATDRTSDHTPAHRRNRMSYTQLACTSSLPTLEEYHARAKAAAPGAFFWQFVSDPAMCTRAFQIVSALPSLLQQFMLPMGS